MGYSKLIPVGLCAAFLSTELKHPTKEESLFIAPFDHTHTVMEPSPEFSTITIVSSTATYSEINIAGLRILKQKDGYLQVGQIVTNPFSTK
jgi:hypothetical protein